MRPRLTPADTTAARDGAATAAADRGRRERAIGLIDEVNRSDPRRLGGEPKALAEGRLATTWIERLRAEAADALVLAARAHHIRRWTLPRDAEPPGRAGYLRWRRRLKDVQADAVEPLLRQAGYDDATIERVRRLVRKDDLKTDADAQSLEDAICLVFLETQLDDFARQVGDDGKVVEVIRKTLPKMTADGRRLALTLDLPPAAAALVARALG